MKEKTLVRWGSPPTGIHNAPIYLGQETETFGLPGIHLEARDNLTGKDYTEALVAGVYDMGHVGTPPLFAALLRTREYAVVGLGLVKYPPFYLLARPEVRGMQDLAHQVIMLNKLHTCPHSIVRTLLRREGMDEAQVQLATLVEGGAIVESIRAGVTAAAVLWEPYVSYAERVFGWRVLAEGRTAMVPSNYAFALYARRSLVSEEPGLVRGMLGAYAQSVRAAQGDPAAAAAAVKCRMPQMQSEDVDRGIMREAPYWSSGTSLDPGLLSHVMRELKIQTVIPERFELADYLVELPQAA